MTDATAPPTQTEDARATNAEVERLVGLAGIPQPLADAMRARGFDALTSVQRAVLDTESEGRDLRVSSQTGSGKTVAIGLALARHLSQAGDRKEGRGARPHRGAAPSVLLLAPTRELAMQVGQELRWLFAGLRGIGVEVVMGGTSLGNERRALARRPEVVVGTPGRVLDHLQAGALATERIAHVVLDEADRMLDMGFREELEAILERMPGERRTHLISATFPDEVRRLADRFQRDAQHIEGTRLGEANADIEHVAHVVERPETYAALVNLLLLNDGARCLVFVERRVDVNELATELSGDGFLAQPFSGELPQAQRTRALNAFRDGSIKILVSTDVAARGIDVPDIEVVIHVDPPTDADTYVHRSGRTGRAGRTGRSVMLVPPRARSRIERLLRQARIEAELKPAPSAGKVRKHLRKRFRRALHERLADDRGATQDRIDHAKQLLDGRDPAAVVAMLLEMAQPTHAREPMELSEPPAPGADTTTAAAPGYVRFSINWGERGGAAPNRLLGHVCRRGEIRGHTVGAIEIGPDESRFDVKSSVAGRFEKLVRRPDPRDPKLRIVRAGSGRGDRPRAMNDSRRGGSRKPRPDARSPRSPKRHR